MGGASESRGGAGERTDTTELVLGQLQGEFEQMLEEAKPLLVSLADKTGRRYYFCTRPNIRPEYIVFVRNKLICGVF